MKLVATVLDALRKMGVAEPGRRIAIIRSWNTSTLLVKHGEFSVDEIAVISEFARTHSFDTVFYPSMPASAANRFNILEQAQLYDGVVALLGGDADDFVERYKFRITPAMRDRP